MENTPRGHGFRIPNEWPSLAQYAFACAVVALSLLVRWMLGGVLGHQVPFLLTIGVLLPLVFLVRPGPFFTAAVLGGAGAMYLFVPPVMGFRLADSAEAAMIGVFAGLLALAMAAAWLSRRATDARELDRHMLRENERRERARGRLLDSLVDGAPLGVFLIGSDLRILRANPIAQQMLGDPPRPMVGNDFKQLVRRIWPPAYADEIVGLVQQTLATGVPCTMPERAEQRIDRGVTEYHQWRIERIPLDEGEYGVVCYLQDLSEQAEARRKIAASEQRFRTLFNSMDEGFCVFEMLFDEHGNPVDYRWLEANPAFEKHTGLTDAVGRTARELVPTLEQRWIDLYGAVAMTGKPARFQGYSAVLGKWFDAEAFRVGPAHKRRVALLFSNITERKRAEEALRGSESRLRFTLEAAKFGTWELDLTASGGYRAVSSPLHDEIFGYTEQRPEWSFEKFLQHVIEEDRAGVEQSFMHARAAAGGDWDFECRIRRTDGEIRWIGARGQAIFDKEGCRPQRMLGLVADITERKEAENALREGARRLRLVTDAVPALIAYVDDELRYRFTNQAYTDWFGMSPEEIHGRHMRELLGEKAFDAFQASVERALSGEAAQLETEVPYKLGGTRFVRAHYVPDVRDDGTVNGVYALVHDVTESKRAELALRVADQRKDEFLAMLAHELRNPLAAVRMALNVMESASNDPGLLLEMKAIIDRQSSQLVHLVEDLLDMGRIARGRITLRRGRVDVCEVVRNLATDIRPQCDTRGLELSVKLPQESISVHADPARFAQVVNNLLQNACKFTERGGKVEVGVERDGSDAVVRVADTGIGLSRDQLERIFEMFAQVDSPLSRKAGGLGIGLSLARTVMELHGGTVEASSAGPGKGSEFLVRMRALEGDARQSEAADTSASQPGRHVASEAEAGRRILAADDNTDALESVASLLRLKGHVIETAVDGMEALEKARLQRPEVLLLDIGMPQMDGYEVARRVRQESWGREMLLIAMTGWGQERDKMQAMEAGFDAHLTKPIDFQALDRLLAVPADTVAPAQSASAGA
jgi:PAS domain S-box-containing protein